MPRIESINPEALATPIGFAHGVATRGGRLLWLAGQNGMDAQGRIVHPGDIVAQTDLALANVLAVVAAAGGGPGDVVKLHFYVSDLDAYRENRRALGQVWRRHFDRWYPAMMLLGVSGFFEPDALVEIDGYAVLPERLRSGKGQSGAAEAGAAEAGAVEAGAVEAGADLGETRS